MKKKALLWVLLAIVVIVSGYFLWKGSSTKSDDSIMIGVILPLTGPVAEPGQNALRGIQTATDIFNADVNNSKKIKLIIEDSKSEPKTGVSSINKLIFTDNIKIVIGDIMSSVFLACAPIAEKNKIVTISPGASAPEVKNAGDYIFRNYLSDDFDGKVMANYLVSKERIKNVGIISV
ncbi:MAG TPA: ABC transporter substrate-binding protein [Salinivirgaceae bacterium]|nr:ABC transporter substrate-binding protein [Salinivirgaceae bacterium]